MYAAANLQAARYLQVAAMPGYGSGMARLWYSQTGKGQHRSNTLYLSEGNFRTERGSVHAAKSLHAGRYLKIKAWPGHGRGYAKLWHSKTGHKGYGSDTLYLKSGHFMVQKGSLIASHDIQVGRYIKLGAMPGFGAGSTSLWYSQTGKGRYFSQTLYLQTGDFRTQEGSIMAAKDVIAGGGLYGSKLTVANAEVAGTITAKHLYLGTSTQSETMENAMELIDETGAGGKPRQEVSALLHELDTSNTNMAKRNAALRADLGSMLARLERLEGMATSRS